MSQLFDSIFKSAEKPAPQAKGVTLVGARPGVAAQGMNPQKEEEQRILQQLEKQAQPKANPISSSGAGGTNLTSSAATTDKPAAGLDLNFPNVGDLLNELVMKALDLKASDIHLEPQEKNMRVRYRVDGMLRVGMEIPKDVIQPLIFKIKIIAKIRTDEHFAPQDGRIRFIIDDQGKYVDSRISILPTSKGEKVVMRLLSNNSATKELAELGMSERDVNVLTKSYSKPYGMILSAGPTGSGKTTTLYTILKNINSVETNISTIEDPVEYDLPGVNHIQVNNKTGLSFAAGLRSLLRQDPNVIMIGEIRDSETAQIATNAALTGHLVLSTIHTNDSVSTIPRLIDMGVEPFLVASTMNIVVAQRLARKICEKCKTTVELTKEDRDILLVKARPDLGALLKDFTAFSKGKGCEECFNTGYNGRVGLYEVLEVTEELRKMISQKASVEEIFALARKNGLRLIVEDGVEKIRLGLTTLDELMRITAVRE